ncbi:MAG: efflux RND transporter permease subunit [Candidatus Hydrogenedentes bacterium]|nr:efflux RND transporter permease subunit [Candidatus Hydrogenedentota bacterium]
MKFSLPALAIRRPITTVMLSITMLGLGVIAWNEMPLQFLPEVSPPFINCSIPYPGASPAQVEQEVAISVEGEFRTIPGLEEIRTISDTNGCFVNMHFTLDTNMALATAEVRDRMERLKLVLPPEVDRMFLQRFNSRSIPIVAIGMFKSGNEDEFINQVRTLIEPRLRRVEGVADVVIYATKPEKEVVVEFDQDRLRSQNLALYEIVAALQSSSLNLSVGELEEGGSKFYVRTLGEYRKLEDLEDLVVGPNALRLRDVATVRYAAREVNQHVAIDGKGGAFLLCIKESEANTVDVVREVHAELDRIRQEPLFREAQVFVFFDQAKLILDALANLMDSGKYGAVMAIAVLFMFMHRLRPTLIVALAIPTSLVVAVVVMYFSGMSLNLVTMVSMIIAVGMLVDNAIVVVENIIRYRQLGHDRVESAERGATDVGMAITASTATTWVVFLPMFYMETGRMSVFMKQLAVPMTVSLGGSLLIALTLIPLAMSQISEQHETRLYRWYQRRQVRRDGTGPSLLNRVVTPLMAIQPIRRVIAAYARTLDVSLRWRLACFLALAMVLGLTYAIPIRNVGMQDLPKLDTREVEITVELDQNFDMEMAGKLFAQLQSEIEPYREQLGIKNIFNFHGAQGGELEVYLFTEDDGPEWATPEYSTDEVKEFLRERLQERRPGAELEFAVADAGESGTGRAISLTMRGDDTDELAEYAEQFMIIMRGMDDLDEIRTDVERTQQEMQLQIDQFLAEQEGVSAMAIAQTVDVALRGARLPYMKQGSREIPVWAQFREEDRKSRENLDNIAVAGVRGNLVPLSQLVEYNRAYTPAAIQRVNSKNVITIYANTESEDLSRIQGRLRDAARNFPMPLGYSIEMGEELREIQMNFSNFLTTLIMSIILIYLVMAALFESYLLPLSILTTVPLAFVGSYWLLYATGTSLDVVTLIGCILMVGLIVNNGIVIVDHVNQLRLQGHTRHDAIVQAGIDRFRPVMMTALTTILGCVPLAIAKSGGAVSFLGLGRALIGGLTVGTLLTLLIVPLFYTLLDDARGWMTNYLGGLLGMGGRREAMLNAEKRAG